MDDEHRKTGEWREIGNFKYFPQSIDEKTYLFLIRGKLVSRFFSENYKISR